MRKCRFPFAGDLSSTSGPDVLVAAITAAIKDDTRFANLNDRPWGPEDVAWFPVGHGMIPQLMQQGAPFAIGPNVLWGDSQQPGACAGEQELMQYTNFAAVYSLSRWYSASHQKHFVQKERHYILDYPVPQKWLEIPHSDAVLAPSLPKMGEDVPLWPPSATNTYNAMIFLKGGEIENKIAKQIFDKFYPTTIRVVTYGKYTRDELFSVARRAKCCFYISREDHYPLAAVEITLMGCPIVSDERSCPVIKHGVNGILSAVRERGESDPFVWAKDAAERMAVEYAGACKLDRSMVRASAIAAHDPALMRERVAAQLGLG